MWGSYQIGYKIIPPSPLINNNGVFLEVKKIYWTAAFLMWASATEAETNQLVERHTTAVNKCKAIDPDEYRSGLAFNPDGYQSYYVRSQCFQRVAIDFRNPALCSEVSRRLALFSSSWGYSERNCRKLVKEKLKKDRIYIEEDKAKVANKLVRLNDFTVTASGNGRDFNLSPTFTSGHGHSYRLDITLIDPQDSTHHALIHSEGYRLNGKGNILIRLQTKEIRERFPKFTLNRPYTVEANLVLVTGSASMNEEFINEVWPLEDRSQTITKTITFSLPKRNPSIHHPRRTMEDGPPKT